MIRQIGKREFFTIIKMTKDYFRQKKNKAFGWTVNFANPISILALVALIILTIVLGVYLKSQ